MDNGATPMNYRLAWGFNTADSLVDCARKKTYIPLLCKISLYQEAPCPTVLIPF